MQRGPKTGWRQGYFTNNSSRKLILTVGDSACLLYATARSFVCSSPPLPTTPFGRRTTLRSLLSSATTTPPLETSPLPRHSFQISLSLSLSLSLRLLTFVACNNSLDSSLSSFPHLSLHSCVYICIHLRCFYKHNCIPTSDSCFWVLLEFPFLLFLRFWRSDFVSWFRAFELLEILVFFPFLLNFSFFSFQFFFVVGGGCPKREEGSLVFCGERKKVNLRILFLFWKLWVQMALQQQQATFAAGCFWSVELAFQRVPGVTKVLSFFLDTTETNLQKLKLRIWRLLLIYCKPFARETNGGVLIFGIVVRTGVGDGIDGSRLHWGQDGGSNIPRSVQWYHRAHGSCAAGIRSCGSLLQTTAGCFLEETRSYSSESPSMFSLLPCVHRWTCLQSLIVRCFTFSFHVTFFLAFPLLLFLDVLTIRNSSSSSLIRASPAVLRMWNISHIQKLGLQICGILLIATHLDQSNYLDNQKQGAVNKYDLTLLIRLLQGSESCAFFQGHSSLPVNPLALTAVHHLRFPVQGHLTYWPSLEML